MYFTTKGAKICQMVIYKDSQRTNTVSYLSLCALCGKPTPTIFAPFVVKNRQTLVTPL